MTWSKTFDAYIGRLGLSSAEVAKALKVPSSSVSYWRRTTTPRAKTCRRVEAWSKGEVPASLRTASIAKARAPRPKAKAA